MNENIPSSNRIYHFFVFLILLLSTSHGQQILLHFLIWSFFAEAYSSNNYFLIWLKAKRALYVITLTPAASTVFVLRGNNVLLFFRSTDFYTDSRIKKREPNNPSIKVWPWKPTVILCREMNDSFLQFNLHYVTVKVKCTFPFNGNYHLLLSS